MTAALLDTCILIDLLRGNGAAMKAVAREKLRPATCPVSVMELYAGVRSQREERAVDLLIATFETCPTDAIAFRRAGEHLRHYAASHALDMPDALIAATAESHGLRLATLNVKHFPMMPRLKSFY